MFLIYFTVTWRQRVFGSGAGDGPAAPEEESLEPKKLESSVMLASLHS